MQDFSLQKAWFTQLQSTILENHRQTTSQFVQTDGKHADYRKCLRENNRTYETMEIWDKIAK